jgi:UV DNA damage endonuclease
MCISCNEDFEIVQKMDEMSITIKVPENFNLGYACINTELRMQKKPVFTSRTLRLATLKEKGMVYLKTLISQNLTDLLTMLEWNKAHNILFMRLSSEMFPFASHPEHGYDIVSYSEELKKIGDYAKSNGMRLTMHPGQFNVLSSPKEDVIKHTLLDLQHHARILDLMGLDQSSVMIIHGGGVYGNKAKSLERLENNISLLPENVKNRLVLENCEMSYCVEDLLPISERLNIPIVLDFHHDAIYPSSNPVEFYFDRVFKVWFDRNIKPKVHISNSVPGIKITDSKTARRKHSDFIYFFHEALLSIKFPIDVMFECKMKEQAILKLK